MAYDHGLVERMRDVLARLSLRHVREKHVFGGWGFMDGRSLFAVAGDEGLILKVAPTEYADVLRLPGVVPFAPMGERAMTTWV
ncbi:MAG: TfoX/Sxy family protein, partial [Gemmatimonadaceae bacterium]